MGLINFINNIVDSVFNSTKTPVEPIPAPIIIQGGLIRPGLNAKEIAARIISRQSEAGAPVGALANGADSVTEKMEIIRVEEIINALLTESKIEVAIPPGTPVTTVGPGNLGIPVVSQGSTVGFISGQGLIR